MLQNVLTEYGINKAACIIQPFGTGLINTTWKVNTANEAYILQRINSNIFTQPQNIAANIQSIASYLSENYPAYLFVAPIPTKKGDTIVFINEEGYCRLFPFIKNSHTVDVAVNPQQAYEAAKQFGAFTKKLASFPAQNLKTTLPDFHNLTLRYQQFELALNKGNTERIQQSINEIKQLKSNAGIVAEFEKIKNDSQFKIRVTHHDTKISNVLFDENNKGLCVIDMDTVMPGYFISDVGDMIRTYVSPVNEEEKELHRIDIRSDYLKAVQEGYLSEMKDELTETEKKYFIYSGKFMIYMQALRFLTDYFNNDIYYGAKYEGHNFNRAKNQLLLLQTLQKFENGLIK
jgi:Ser/Thr protein kinase RdoA (MazF antagonist)